MDQLLVSAVVYSKSVNLVIILIFCSKLMAMHYDDDFGFNSNYFESDEWNIFQEEIKSFLYDGPIDEKEERESHAILEGQDSFGCLLESQAEEILADQLIVQQSDFVEKTELSPIKDAQEVDKLVINTMVTIDKQYYTFEERSINTAIRYFCTYCKENFLSKHKKAHELWHDSLRCYKCADCKIGFKDNKQLTAHRKSNVCSPQRNRSFFPLEHLVQKPIKKKSSVLVCECGYINTKKCIFANHKKQKHCKEYICVYQNCRQIDSQVNSQYDNDGLKISISLGAHRQHLEEHKKRGDPLFELKKK